MDILDSLLSDEQRTSLELYGYFDEVIGEERWRLRERPAIHKLLKHLGGTLWWAYSTYPILLRKGEVLSAIARGRRENRHTLAVILLSLRSGIHAPACGVEVTMSLVPRKKVKDGT